MAVTYDDIEEKNLGRQEKINQLADMKLMNDLADTEQNIAKEEAELDAKGDATLMEDAKQIVAEMDALRERGEDPMKLFEMLPPELQEGVTQLLSNEEQQQSGATQEGMSMEQQGVPMMDAVQQQQQPTNDLVAQAKELTTV